MIPLKLWQMNICVWIFPQGGDRRDSPHRGSQSGHWPPLCLNNTLRKWHEPQRVDVYLQGGAHKGSQPLPSVSNMVINVYDCFTALFLSSLQFSAFTTINDTVLNMSCYLTARASWPKCWATSCRTKCFYNCPPLVPVQVLLASCFVPVYAGLKPVELRGKVRVYAGVRTKSIGSWCSTGTSDSFRVFGARKC